jgi:hypothetical protein
MIIIVTVAETRINWQDRIGKQGHEKERRVR